MTGSGLDCYYCGRSNHEDNLFCGYCGHSLQVERCETCRHLIAPSSFFCAFCGVALVSGANAGAAFPEEQLRQVTVLFAYLTGLQDLVEHLDPELFKDLLDSCFRILTAEIQPRGGTIDKYMADSLLALFGVPVAHEDDPARAVAAAIGMQQSMDRFNRRLFESSGYQLGLRIGINTGKVLVGHVASDARAVTVMGDVVNTASRVQNATPVGGILICDSTRRGIGTQFKLRPQPPLLVKGKAEPLSVYRVLGDATTSGESGLDLSHLPLIGREKEFERLALLWRQMVRPTGLSRTLRGLQGTWITLIGDVGMGKERLVREFQHYVTLDPCQPQVHSARATSLAATSSPVVLRRLIGSLAGVRPEDDLARETQRVHELVQVLADDDAEAAETVRPEVAAQSLLRLMGIASDYTDRRLLVEPSGFSDRIPGRERRRLRQEGFIHLREICARLARRAPLLLLLRDIQWAEDAALDFLETLGKHPPYRLMLVTSARPSLSDRRPTWGQANPAHETVTLGPLTLRDSITLMRAMAGEQDSTPPSVMEALYAFTGGNPLYLSETFQNYLETQSDRNIADAEEFNVPDSIEGVIQSRLDRLSFEQGLTLRAAAVIGPTFWGGAVAAVLNSPRDDALESLCERGFIQRREHASLPNEQEYSFEHQLTVKVAAGNLLEAVRQRYHRAVAEWLEARNSSEFPLDVGIAHHFEAGNMLKRAIPYFIRAGARSLSAYDCAEAIRLFDSALAAYDPQSEALEELDKGMHAQLLAQRGEARRMLAENEVALEDFRMSARLFLELREPIRAASSLYRMGQVYLALGVHAAARDAAEQADGYLKGHLEPAVAAVGRHLWSELLLADKKPQEARRQLEQALLLWRRTGDKWSLAAGLTTLGRLYFSESDLHGAWRSYREAVVLRDSLGDTHGLATTLHNLGAVAHRLGNFQEARSHFHRSLRLHRRLSNRTGVAATLLNQGSGYTRCGYFGRARLALEEALTIGRALERAMWVGACYGNLGQLWLQVGKLDVAMSCLKQALEVFQNLGDAEWQAELLVDMAKVHLLGNDLDQADRYGIEALAFIQRIPGGEIEARVLLFMVLLNIVQGDAATARHYIEELEWNEALEVTPELKLDSALLYGRMFVLEQRVSRAILQFEEAERIAASHDLVPGLWEASSRRHHVLVNNNDPAAAQTRAKLTELFHEYLARVEETELIEQLQTSAGLIGASDS